MLQMFAFGHLSLLMSDLYFVNPTPGPNQEGPERGVRLELRLLDRLPLKGSIYSAQPIAIGTPIWRVDLLESVSSAPGSLDRAHHHPRFDGWEPGRRHFVKDLSANPVGWLANELRDVSAVLVRAGIDPSDVAADDIADIERSAHEIVTALKAMLDRVAAGDLGQPPATGELVSARAGWL